MDETKKEKALERYELECSREDYRNENKGIQSWVDSKEGRRALWWLLGKCGTFLTPQSEQDIGMQNIGHLLLERLSLVDDDAFILTLTENRNVERDRNRKRANTKSRNDDGGYEPNLD